MKVTLVMMTNGCWVKHPIATTYDLRALYSVSSSKKNAAGGVFAGRMQERNRNYYGATIMAGYSNVGIAVDYLRMNVKYNDVQWVYTDGRSVATPLGSGSEGVNGLFAKIYVQMMRH